MQYFELIYIGCCFFFDESKTEHEIVFYQKKILFQLRKLKTNFCTYLIFNCPSKTADQQFSENKINLVHHTNRFNETT